MKKKIILYSSIVVIAIIGILFALQYNEEENNSDKKSLKAVKEQFQSDILLLKDGKYTNLVYHDFETTIENVEGIYNLEILTDNTYLDNTFLENFEKMEGAVNKFFKEDFDKSYLNVDFTLVEGEEPIFVNYYDIKNTCNDEKFNQPRTEYLFGNNVSNGGYMVQISESLANTWFSKGELGAIHPSVEIEYRKVYYYVSGIRQVDDAELRLIDKTIMLSEMEEKVLNYLNNDFPLPMGDNISLSIGDVRILDNGEYDGVCFKTRRVYKGVHFEYGSNYSVGIYNDVLDNDKGEITYAYSDKPDTMLSFGRVGGTVVEKSEITELITLRSALEKLSNKIGENSIYDVYGVELVYRNCEIEEERVEQVDDILSPKWKIITINQNDDKYTLFYVDVVTGEITERFEYYYE